jgi:hypothetical protein
MSELALRESRFREYKAELLKQVSDDVLKRLVQAYQIKNPVESMEDKLGEILLEVLQDED